jgi:hypothetical protein
MSRRLRRLFVAFELRDLFSFSSEGDFRLWGRFQPQK